MARYYAAYRAGDWSFYESRQLSLAAQLGIDVFVSHQSGDSDLAGKIAAAIQRNGLAVWLDLVDPSATGDGPNLADYIETVLRQSTALPAVVTAHTQKSWWVPFEIGIAFELSKYLASFGDKRLNPSFLAKWPNIPDEPRGRPDINDQLRSLCGRLKRLSRVPTRSSYLAEMRSMSAAH